VVSQETPAPERQARYRWTAQLGECSRVLDAACGSGWGTAVLAGNAETATGVDLSPAAIAEARKRHGDMASFREGDLRALPFAAGEFDRVVCFEAIAHLADPGEVSDELRRVLRPGGLLLASAPNRLAYPPGNPLHLSELSSGELEELLRERFANVAIYRQQSYFASLLCDDAMLDHDDRATLIAPETTKTVGGPPGSELYTVAMASDEELPGAPPQLVLGEDVEYTAQQRMLEEWRVRAVEAEAEAEALRRKLRELQS
jgi:SAM-dependent methyltransferase